MSSSFSSGTRTITVPGHDEYMDYLIRQQNPCFEQYERTPSPTPPPNAGILRKPERPRSAKAGQMVHEPHQCALGLQCTRQIDRFIYHKIKAIYLTGRAMQLCLPVNPYPGGDHTLSYYRNVCESLTDMLGWRRVDPGDVLREIQSPEYWEAEKEYLESPGCLAKRQKVLSAASPDVLSDISSIEASDHESPRQESSIKGSWQPRQQGGSGEIEAVVDSVSTANHCPSQIHLQKAQSRAWMSTSLASNIEANSPTRSSGRKVIPTNSLGPNNTNKSIASPSIVSGEAGRKQEYTGLGKRKSGEEMAVSDDTAPRKRRLYQARPRIADRHYREVKRNRLIDSSPSEAITDSSQKHQRAGKHTHNLQKHQTKFTLRQQCFIACLSKSNSCSSGR